MSLWCCACFNMDAFTKEMGYRERMIIGDMLESRYKVYDDTKNKIVLACGTRDDVLKLLLKEKEAGRENLGNIQLMKSKLDFKLFTDVREQSELTIQVMIVAKGLNYEQFKERYNYVIDELKKKKRLDKNFNGKFDVFHISPYWMDRETDGIIIGEHKKGYRFLNVNGRVLDITYKDVKLYRIWNMRKGIRIGDIQNFPKIELEEKAWDKINDTVETCGSNWHIGSDGKIVLNSSNEILDIKIGSLDGVKTLEVANTNNMISSLMVKTGPKVLGKINSERLERILLPDTIEVISSGALIYSNIKKIDLKRCKNLRVIHSEAFAYTRSLEGLDLPDTVEKIGARFLNSSSAKYLILPRYLSDIDLQIFKGALNLKTIVMPSMKLNADNFRNKVGYSLTELEEIWVEDEFYDSALNFYEALSSTRSIKKNINIVKVKRKV